MQGVWSLFTSPLFLLKIETQLFNSLPHTPPPQPWPAWLVGGKRGSRMRSHPSPTNSHQSGPMLEPQREEAIAHSTGAHSASTQGGCGGPRPFNPSGPGLLLSALRCTTSLRWLRCRRRRLFFFIIMHLAAGRGCVWKSSPLLC